MVAFDDNVAFVGIANDDVANELMAVDVDTAAFVCAIDEAAAEADADADADADDDNDDGDFDLAVVDATNSNCCCWMRCATIADETGKSITPNLSECRISGVCRICEINSSWFGSSFGNARCNNCI